MRLGKRQSHAGSASEGTAKRRAREGGGWGPFTGGQLTAIILAVVAVVGVPAIASAVIPNGNTYNACAAKSNGALRVIDTSKHQKCNKSTETAVSWSKVGATGPRGLQGVRGLQGGQGNRGPSDGWSSFNVNFSSVSGSANVVSLSLPAGSFVVDWSVSLGID